MVRDGGIVHYETCCCFVKIIVFFLSFIETGLENAIAFNVFLVLIKKNLFVLIRISLDSFI